jgi:tetratricopeptide (TPR) repeat protein
MPDVSAPPDAPDASASEHSAGNTARAVRNRFASHGGRWVLVVLTVASLVAIFHRRIEQSFRRTAAQYHADEASDFLRTQNVPAALQSVEQALAWMPGDASLVYLRAQIHAEAENWDASLADYTRITDELAPNFAIAYSKRADIHRNRANYRDALLDLDRAVALSPTDDPVLLNDRAYVRALAGKQLDQALAEIELAIELIKQQAQRRGRDTDVPPEYLDTLGYIQFRLGNYDAALEQVQLAVDKLQEHRALACKELNRRKQPLGQKMRMFDRIQAEIVYHRGLIFQAQGEAKLARDDLKLANDLGYQPPHQE